MYHDFMSAVTKYMDDTAEHIVRKKTVSKEIPVTAEENMLKTIASKYESLAAAVLKLEEDIAKAEKISDELKKAKFYHDPVLSDMEEVRKYADYIEQYIPDSYLPYPTYSKILFYV